MTLALLLSDSKAVCNISHKSNRHTDKTDRRADTQKSSQN